MSKQEFSRLDVLLRVQSGRLRISDACVLIGLQRRQVFRLLRGLKQDGATSLLSKRRGKPSNHQLPAEVRTLALSIVRDRYADFGPILCSIRLRLCAPPMRWPGQSFRKRGLCVSEGNHDLFSRQAPRVLEDGAFEMRGVEAGAFEMRARQLGAFEMRAREVGFEMRALEVGAFEMRALEVGAFSHEDGTLEGVARLGRDAGSPQGSTVKSRDANNWRPHVCGSPGFAA